MGLMNTAHKSYMLPSGSGRYSLVYVRHMVGATFQWGPGDRVTFKRGLYTNVLFAYVLVVQNLLFLNAIFRSL